MTRYTELYERMWASADVEDVYLPGDEELAQNYVYRAHWAGVTPFCDHSGCDACGLIDKARKNQDHDPLWHTHPKKRGRKWNKVD